jgi:hypothetical protein
VTGGILLTTAGGSVRGPKYDGYARQDAGALATRCARCWTQLIPANSLACADRALLGLMGYTFARVSEVVTLRVEDFSRVADPG